MEFNDESKIRATLLYHLRRKRAIGGVHTHFDTLRRGFPSHISKDVKKIGEKLIKEGLIIKKPTAYGLQISLNNEKLKEIDAFIHKVLGFKFSI